jgi:hypothetical protein
LNTIVLSFFFFFFCNFSTCRRKPDGKPTQPDPPGPRIVLGGASRDQVSIQLSGSNAFGKMQPQFLLKSSIGGIIIIEVGVSEPYAYSKIYALERTRLQPKHSHPLSRQVWANTFLFGLWI